MSTSRVSATKKIKEERVSVKVSTEEIQDRNLSQRLALTGL